MVVVHEVFTHLFESICDDGSGLSESIENGVYIITLFHRYDSGVILFVNPDKEVSGFVMENTTSIGPVTTTTR